LDSVRVELCKDARRVESCFGDEFVRRVSAEGEIEIEIEVVYNMYRMRRFIPNTVRAGCCLWALPTMPFGELTSHG
jgi:hypothetical protein